MATCAVLGATSWGLTLAWRLHQNGHSVIILTRDEPEAQRLRADRGLARLPEVTLPPGVAILPASASRSPSPTQWERGSGGEGLVVAVPAQYFASSLSLLPAAWRDVPALSVAKGLDQRGGLRMSQVLVNAGWPPANVAALSGPNLAHEVARGLPAAAVVASTSDAVARSWQQTLSGGTFRIYRSTDVVGVELCGSLKNVIAIAAGACAGLEFGANAVAALMTRGLAEITRLGVALGAQPATFQGLAGVGDMAATCFSPLSRNRRLGDLLAQGLPSNEALLRIGEAVEGAATAPVALAMARDAGVDVPIVEQVCAVLAGRAAVRDAVSALLSRPLTTEAAPPG